MGLFSKKGTLLRSQKKAVFEMLRLAQLEPSDFEWSEADANGIAVSRLNYRHADYYFQFSSYETGAYCIASPGAFQLVEYEYPRGWAQQADTFRNWTEHVRREVACRDPWEEIEKFRLAITAGAGFDGPNETISGAEVEQISRHLAGLDDEIEMEFRLSGEQAAFTRERLAYLAQAAMRLKSRDWCFAAIGLCATLAMALSFDADQAGRLWLLVKRRLGEFVRLSDRPADPSAAA